MDTYNAKNEKNFRDTQFYAPCSMHQQMNANFNAYNALHVRHRMHIEATAMLATRIEHIRVNNSVTLLHFPPSFFPMRGWKRF